MATWPSVEELEAEVAGGTQQPRFPSVEELEREVASINPEQPGLFGYGWHSLKEHSKDAVKSVIGAAQGLVNYNALGDLPPEEHRTDEMKLYAERVGKVNDWFEGLKNVDMLKPDKSVEPPDSIAGKLAYGAVGMAPQMAGQLAAYRLGGPGAAMGTIGAQIAGSDYNTLTGMMSKEEAAQKGLAPEKLQQMGVDYNSLPDKKISPARAFEAGVRDAAVQAPMEQFSLGKAMKVFKTDKPIARALEGAATEAGTEFIQQFPQDYAEIWGKRPDATFGERNSEFIDNIGDTATEGLYAGGSAGLFSLGLGGLGVAANKMGRKTLQSNQVEEPVSNDSASLYDAIVGQESGGNHNAVNPDSGARGNIQWMPGTWAQEAASVYGDNAPTIENATPEQQDTVARAYIDRLHKELGSPELVAAAIYAGEGYAQSLKDGKPLYDPSVRMGRDGYLNENGAYPSVNEYIEQVMGRVGGTSKTAAKPSNANSFNFDELIQEQKLTNEQLNDIKDWAENKVFTDNNITIEDENFINDSIDKGKAGIYEIAYKYPLDIAEIFKNKDNQSVEGQQVSESILNNQEKVEKENEGRKSAPHMSFNDAYNFNAGGYLTPGLSKKADKMSDKFLLDMVDKLVDKPQNIQQVRVASGELARRGILPPAVHEGIDVDREMINIAKDRIMAEALKLQAQDMDQRQAVAQQLANATNAIAVQKWDNAKSEIDAIVDNARPQKTSSLFSPPETQKKLMDLTNEKPMEIVTPQKNEVRPETIKAIDDLRQQVLISNPQETMLPTAEQANLKRQLRRAVTAKDYPRAINLARQLGLEENAQLYENAAETQSGDNKIRERMTVADIKRSTAYDQLNDIEKLFVDLVEYYKTTPRAIEAELQNEYNGIINDYTAVLRGQMKQGVQRKSMTPTVDSRGNATGEYVFNAGYSQNYKWYQDLLKANGGRTPGKKVINESLRDIALNHLRNGYIDPLYGEGISDVNYFNDLEAAINGIEGIIEKISPAIRTEGQGTQPSRSGSVEDIRQAARNAVPIAKAIREPEINQKIPLVTQKDNKNTDFLMQADHELSGERQEIVEKLQENGVDNDKASKAADAILRERRKKMRTDDSVTGFQKGEYRNPTLDRAWKDHEETGRDFAYADIDFSNLGGLNAHAGTNSAADVHVRATADIVKQTVNDHGIKNVQFFRHGGDEWSILAPDISKEKLDAALNDASTKVKEYAKVNGLDQIYHPKLQKNTGIGIYFGTGNMSRFPNIQELITNAEKETTKGKKALKGDDLHVDGNITGESRVIAPKGQTGGVGESVPKVRSGTGSEKTHTGRDSGQSSQLEGQGRLPGAGLNKEASDNAKPLSGASSIKKLNSGIDPTGGKFDDIEIVAELKKLGSNMKKAMPKLIELGKSLLEQGYTAPRSWVKKMREMLGDMWETYKGEISTVWKQVSSHLDNEPGRVRVGNAVVSSASIAGMPATKLKDPAVQGWAERYWKELGVKSPFFMRWFGNWRMNDHTPVNIVKVKGNEITSKSDVKQAKSEIISWVKNNKAIRQVVKNQDTGWDIHISRDGLGETVHWAEQFTNIYSVRALAELPNILKNAVIVSTELNRYGANNQNPIVHVFYSPVEIGGRRFNAKIAVKEIAEVNKPIREKFYHLETIQIRPFYGTVPGANSSRNLNPQNGLSTITVSDMMKNVKKEHHANISDISKVINREGKPQIVYPANQANLKAFDAIGDTAGIWFTTARANNDSPPVYLNIRKPATMRNFSTSRKKAIEQGINAKDKKALNKAIVEDLRNSGYDGVHHKSPMDSSDVWVAFSPEQIKSVDNIGTFDASTSNVKYMIAGKKASNQPSKNNERDNNDSSSNLKSRSLVPGREATIASGSNSTNGSNSDRIAQKQNNVNESVNSANDVSIIKQPGRKGYPDGLYYRYTNSNSPMSDYGHAMFAENHNSVEHYGKNLFIFDGSNAISTEKLKGLIKKEWKKSQRSGDFGPNISSDIETLSADEVAESFAPQDIVDSADSYDNGEMLSWLWEKVLEPNNIQAIITNNGAMVFNENLVHKATMDDHGAVTYEQPESDFRKAGNYQVNNSTLSDKKITIDQLKEKFPTFKFEEGKDGFLATTPTGKFVEFKLNTEIPIDLDVIRKAYGEDVAKEVEKGAAGAVGRTLSMQSEYGNVSWGAVVELSKSADLGVVDHETVHVVKALGLIPENAWKALSRKYDPNGKMNEAELEEAVAEAYREWNGDSKSNIVFGRVKKFFNDLYMMIASPEVRKLFRSIQNGSVFAKRSESEAAAFKEILGHAYLTSKKESDSLQDTAKSSSIETSAMYALDGLKKKLGFKAAEGVEVKGKPANPNHLAPVGRHIATTARLSKTHPKLRPFFRLATIAMERQEKLRNHFAHRIDKWEAILGRTKLSNIGLSSKAYKENKRSLHNLLWQGDLLGKDFSAAELKEAGYNSAVIKAYRMVRAAMDYAYKLSNEVRQGIEHKSENMNKYKLDKLKANKFADILSIKDLGQDNYFVSWKQPKVRENVSTMTGAELNELLNNPDVQVLTNSDGSLKIKSLDNTSVHIMPNQKGLLRGEGWYEVEYLQQTPPISKRGGYIPHFFHEWFIMEKVKDENGKEQYKMLHSATSAGEAVKWGNQFVEKNKGREVVIQPKQFKFPGADVNAAVLGDNDYFRLSKKVSEDLSISLSDAKELLDGKVKMKNRHRFMGSFMERKGAKGYEKDLDWVLKHHFNMVSRYVALDPFKSQSLSAFERHFGKFDDAKHDSLAGFVRDYINDINGVPTEIEKALNAILEMSPTFNKFLGTVLLQGGSLGSRPAAQVVSSFTDAMFVAKLALLNVSSAMLQTTQFLNVYAKIDDYAIKAIPSAFKPNMIEKMVLHRTGIDANLNLSSGAGYSKRRQAKNVIQSTGVMFGYMDTLMRRIAVIGAYRKAKDEGKSQQEAIVYAKDINLKTNFDYGVNNAPNIFRRGGPVSQASLQFKKYGVMQLEFLADLLWNGTVKENARFWVPFILVSGIFGVPFFDLLDEWAELFRGWSPKKEIKAVALEYARKGPVERAIAHTLIYGVFSNKELGGVDVSRRVGLGDVLPNSSSDLLGVAFSTIWNVSKQVLDGNTVEAIRAFSPGLGNPIVAIAGETRDARGRIRTKYDSPYERVVKGLGFMPSDESIERDADQIAKYKKRGHSEKEKEAIDNFIKAYKDKDKEEMKKASQELQELGVSGKRVKTEILKKEKTSLERTKDNLNKIQRREYQFIED